MKRSIIFFILFLLSVPLLSWAKVKKTNLIAYDQFAKPGEKIYLMAMLRKGFLSIKPEISGERIEFFRNKKSLGIALTGTDGTAVKEIPPLSVGLYSFSAKLPEKARYTAEEADGILACWDPRTPIIIVDMDTLSEIERIDFPFRKIKRDSKPLKDAPQVLKRLSKDYNIIYLTNRDELLLNKTRLWLKDNRFPIAPVFSIKADEDSLAKEYAERIKDWKKDGWDIKIGIGNIPQHAEAYLDNGMKAIILEDEEELPEKAIMVKGWKEIEKTILKLLKSHKSIN
jgi:hypothetical protein